MYLVLREELRERNGPQISTTGPRVHFSLSKVILLFLNSWLPIDTLPREYFEFRFDRQCYKTSSPFSLPFWWLVRSLLSSGSLCWLCFFNSLGTGSVGGFHPPRGVFWVTEVAPCLCTRRFFIRLAADAYSLMDDVIPLKLLCLKRAW